MAADGGGEGESGGKKLALAKAEASERLRAKNSPFPMSGCFRFLLLGSSMLKIFERARNTHRESVFEEVLKVC